MFFLLSGEGPTDMGSGTRPFEVCERDDFDEGPMAVMVDQIVESGKSWSPLGRKCVGFVSEHRLTQRAATVRKDRRTPRLPGKKNGQETGHFYQHARALAIIATEQKAKRNDDVIIVYFRDADGTRSAKRGDRDAKRKSMRDAFIQQGFQKAGVAMIPQPKSEAWLLCALKKKGPYTGCAKLEFRSGNDKSPKSLKKELKECLGGDPDRESLADLVRNRTVDLDEDGFDMPSFNQFRKDLEAAIQ